MDYPIEITLKNGVLKPNFVSLNLLTGQFDKNPSILLKILKDQSNSYSNLSTMRKYIFIIEEIDEETGPLCPGDEYLFENFIGCKNGKYHLTCINYPKLQCEIQIINEQVLAINQRKSNTIINLSGLQSVQQKEQQNKEDFGKEENQWAKSEEELSQNPLGTPKKAEISDFDKILSNEKQYEQTIENRYLRYFQEEFKIWRNFFSQNQQELQPKQLSQDNQQKLSTPIKQKPKSEQRKNSDVVQQNNKIQNWSKRQNYSPDFKFALSCGSPSNNQNLSQFDKQKSVLSLLHSHQDNYRIDDELQKESKTMKKTNSQYRLNIQDGQKKDSEADTASKKKQKKNKVGSFMEWLDSWAESKEALRLKERDDDHVVKQWLAHMQNKYKISKFMFD